MKRMDTAYLHHAALNLGHLVRDLRDIFSHPSAPFVAPEGGPRRLLASIALSVPDLCRDVYYMVVPPHLTSTEEDLAEFRPMTAKDWFLIGNTPNP